MERIQKIITTILVAVIIVSFFLPWVKVQSAAVGKITEALTGKQQQKDTYTISGFKVPVLANSSESRLIMSIIQLFNPGIKDADKKSYLILIVPGLAVIMLVVKLFLDKNRWINLLFGVIGSLIFFVALYKILTTDLDKLILRVAIGWGLWLILFSYLGIGLICLARSINLLKDKSS